MNRSNQRAQDVRAHEKQKKTRKKWRNTNSKSLCRLPSHVAAKRVDSTQDNTLRIGYLHHVVSLNPTYGATGTHRPTVMSSTVKHTSCSVRPMDCVVLVTR